ncbi:MAG TPA: C39 family peptidase [Desulfuromonadales bacterium]|nr:C39 family peptidase [Desulfuromonadales bacterium]
MTGRLLLVLIALAASGCTPFRQEFWTREQVGLHVIQGVPYRPQEQRDDCGPSALASLLAYRGRDVPVGEISRAVYEPKLGGSLLPDMENFARQQGFATRSGRGDLDLLRQAIDADRPVVIPIETGFWRISRPHYLVVFGYDQRRFLTHAGVREGVFIDADELLRRWEKMNRLYLYLE